MTKMGDIRLRVAPFVVAFVVLSACGGGNGRGLPDDGPGSDEAFGAIPGAGGGGTLIFDGEEIRIDSVVCVLTDDAIDVGTVSEPGHRVLLGTNNPFNPISAQILTPDFLQWFPQNASGDQAQRDGKTFTSGPRPYFNNSDDRIIEASFTVECP